MLTKKIVFALAAMLAAMMLVMAACGDDDDFGGVDVPAGDDSGDDSTDDDSGDDSGDDPGDDDDTGDDAGDDASGDDISGFDVCNLLTDDEVAAALDAEMTHESTPLTCDWEATELTDIKFLTVAIILDDEDEARDTLEATALVFGDEAVDEIDGVGDSAVFSSQIGLEILIDDDYLRIDVYGTQLGDELEIETALAELALDRMP